jgi:L-threonylcarbamoyladenylate synthase
MPQVLQWQHAPDAQRAVVETCRQSLLRGELVTLPTEAVYVLAASALHPEAVARLAARRGEDAPLPAVALRRPEEARDWVPELGPLGRRLVRRCWPGPVLLVARGAGVGLASRLPDGVQRVVCPGGTIGLGIPYHEAVRQVLERLPVPVVLGEVPGGGGGPVTTPEELPSFAAEEVAVVVADGPTRFGRPATVVELRGETWQVRREGVVGAGELARSAAKLVVFVCTGNTCRSPLAEALCKKLLADRLGCPVEELSGRGFVVLSAGLAAVRGEPAASEAVEVARELGADLSGHSSRPATPDLLAQADLIVGMTGSHLHAVAAYPGLASRARLLGGEAGDLADPIGGDRAVYQACAGAIWQHLHGLVAELLA